MGDYLGLIWTNLLTYVFGSSVYLGVFALLFVTMLMYRMNLPLDAMIVVWIPMLYMLSWSAIVNAGGTAVIVAVFGLAGLVILFALKFIRRG